MILGIYPSLNLHYSAFEASAEGPLPDIIDFQTDPSRYRHWRVKYDGSVANLTMDVDEDGGLFEGYKLKLNTYDLGVDIKFSFSL